MNDISNIKKINNDFYIDLESPHYVRICDDLNNIDFQNPVAGRYLTKKEAPKSKKHRPKTRPVNSFEVL